LREASYSRETKETKIEVNLNIDGKGEAEVETPCGFFNHMLESFAKHSLFDLSLKAKGDVEVDYHHLVEDTGIVIGRAFKEALGEKRAIVRFADALVPMDSSLAQVALDISGRAYLAFYASFPTYKVGDFDTELVKEFFEGFVRGAEVTLHIRLIESGNTHHSIEAIFKAFARALYNASRIRENQEGVPSTKGVL